MNHRAITIHFASAKDIVCTFTHKANESVPKRSSLLAVTRCLSTVESKLEKDTPVWTFPREGLLWSDETSRVGNARSRPWLHKEKSQTRIYIWNNRCRVVFFFKSFFERHEERERQRKEYGWVEEGRSLRFQSNCNHLHFHITNPPPWNQYSPETVLKKKRRNEALAAKAAEKAVVDKKARRASRADAFRKAEKYVKEYKSIERSNIRMKRQARASGNFFYEPEAKLVAVIRIRGIIGIAPKTRKILQLLRLRQIHNCVLVRCNKATINMLRLVEPYIAYGYPNLKTIRQLVYKRGYGKVNKQRIALTDNSIVEKALGAKGLTCVEDVIHELFTVGPSFKEANNFMWPYKLSSPRGGYKKKLTHFNEGGDAGNRMEKINAMIQRML